MPSSLKNDLDLRWYVVITKYRNEKHVREILIDQGIHAHVPLRKVVRTYSSRKKTHYLPLINCHVFIKMNLREHVKVLETPGVIGFIKFSGKIAEIPDDEMNAMERIAQVDYPVVVSRTQFSEGDLVEVVQGGLTGLRGSLVQINNTKKFVVSCHSIGHSITIEIDGRYLTKVK